MSAPTSPVTPLAAARGTDAQPRRGWTAVPEHVRKGQVWVEEFEAAVVLDADVGAVLEEAGWTVVTLWECQPTDGRDLRDLLGFDDGREVLKSVECEPVLR